LNTNTFFQTVRAVLDKNTELLQPGDNDRDYAARSLIVKIVNALTSGSEIGGPSVCSHLLGFSDHYTSHTFKVFYWYSYVLAIIRSDYEDARPPDEHVQCEERIMLGYTSSGVVQLNRVNDYVHRPAFFAHWTLYEFLRQTDVRKLRKKENFKPTEEDHFDADDDEAEIEPPPTGRAYRFAAGHPLRATHGVYLRPIKTAYILNFVGRALPRPDRGDRDEYCKVMLTLFAPGGWQKGSDLHRLGESWIAAFERVSFDVQHERVMRNMNLLYECSDARDDFSA
ncbi:hypothetical protein OH76DRAFT_1322080, partial [Lentinus brumalis]